MIEQLTPAGLVEDARAELCACWRRGELVQAELILHRYPTLEADPDAALQVIYQEILLREERGELPQFEEYEARFPHLAAQLRPLFVVHRVLEARSRSWQSTPAPAGQDSVSESSGPACETPVVPGYEILGQLGRGGMGVVYRARQLHLNREVALKMIAAGAYADPAARDRFRAEAQAQAHLQHPHVVQIFEVGETAGCPYLALEFVAGGSLARKLAGIPQPTRASAQMVETLARAIHYAHERGVIHRDLKPANILLSGGVVSDEWSGDAPLTTHHSPRTTPKITDFGLATWLEGETGLSSTGSVMGTPSYMAPEQARGHTKKVGPPTDVYALGAILYEMLTGRPPFLGETALDTLQQVRDQEPVPPRRLQPKIPRDLEAICLKCLDKEPDRRYPSASLLADDLRRFLHGQSTRARPMGPAARLSRWCRRQPVLAGLAAALVVALVAGFAGVTWQWLRADRLRGQAETNLAESERQRERAVTAEARSQRRFQEVRNLAHTFLFDLYDKLEPLAGAAPVREFLVATALTYLDKLAQESGDDLELRREIGDAYIRVADVRGNSVISQHRGDPRAAAANYRKAMAIADSLIEANPGDIAAQYCRAVCHERIGEIYMEEGRPEQALSNFGRFRELTELILQQEPNHPDAGRNLPVSYSRIAAAQAALGQAADALANYRHCLEWAQGLAREHPDDPLVQRDLAVSYWHVGNVQTTLGQPADALATYQKVLEILQFVATKEPDNIRAQRDVAMAYQSMGEVQTVLDQWADALASYRHVIDINQALFKADATDARAQKDLAMGCQRMGDAQLALNQPSEALTTFQRSVELFQPLAQANPDNLLAQLDLSSSQRKIGEVQAHLGQHQEALATFQRCVDRDRATVQANPNNRLAARFLSIGYTQLGDTQLALGQKSEALASYQECRKLQQGLVDAEPTDVQIRRALSRSVRKVGDAQVALGQQVEALATFRQAMDFDRNLVQATPNDNQALRQLTVDLAIVGDAQLALGQKSEALASYQECVTLRESLVRAAPADVRAQRSLAFGYAKVGDAQFALSRASSALASYQHCLDLRRALVKSNPEDVDIQRELGITYRRLGEVHSRLASEAGRTRADRMEHRQRALEWFRRAMGQVALLPTGLTPAAHDAGLLEELTADIESCEIALCDLEAQEQADKQP
jgi:tetratricopeptide (TPR) repeat protein